MPRNYENYITYLNSTLRIPDSHRYVALDLFAGCGGLSLGFEAAGIKTIGYEMMDDCCQTYRKNLNSVCNQDFITTEMNFPAADVIIGGPPCQPFSRRGKQKGKDDERNGFPAFIEAIRKVNPPIWICENVKGLPEQNKEYFNSVIDEFKSLGYEVDYRVVKMVQYDVPQNRERLVIVGHRGGFSFPEPNEYKVTAGEALGDLATSIPENAAFLTPSMDSYIAAYEAASKCKVPRDLHMDRPARTLTCRNLAGATSDMHRIKLPDGRRRRITVREAARLQGFPDWFEFCGNEESQFTQIGNAVPPLFAYRLANSVVDYLKHKKGELMSNNSLKINYKTFNKKSPKVQQLILESLYIIASLGIPVDDLTERQKEKMAMALLAVGGVKSSAGWKKIKDSNSDYSLTTREIITFYNHNFEENISSGSYDDIRRKDLQRLIQAGIVKKSKPDANTSNPTRGYKISSVYSKIIRNYGQPDWQVQVDAFNEMHPTYAERLGAKRNMPKINVKTEDGTEFQLNDGEHNVIQKKIVEELLPRFGNNPVLLYCGDADNKYGVIYEKEKMNDLGISNIKAGKLPDVVAYSRVKGWIYLIEAYHTSNPITPQRKIELEELLGDAVEKAVFITAFDNITAYKNCPEKLAWETEAWIATEPDHMIHLNGSRFMGPYGK